MLQKLPVVVVFRSLPLNLVGNSSIALGTSFCRCRRTLVLDFSYLHGDFSIIHIRVRQYAFCVKTIPSFQRKLRIPSIFICHLPEAFFLTAHWKCTYLPASMEYPSFEPCLFCSFLTFYLVLCNAKKKSKYLWTLQIYISTDKNIN